MDCNMNMLTPDQIACAVLDDEGGGFIGDRNTAFDSTLGKKALKDNQIDWLPHPESKKGFMYPKLIRVSFTFYPFETKPLLWQLDQEAEKPVFSRQGFPYAFPDDFFYEPTAAVPPTVTHELAESRQDAILEG